MNLNSLFHKTRPVISLFHLPTHHASRTVLALLHRDHARRAENPGGRGAGHREFDLEVSESLPTSTQLGTILDIVGSDAVGTVVPGALSKRDAIESLDRARKGRTGSESGSGSGSESESVTGDDGDGVEDGIVRPIVVDWGNARCVVGPDTEKIAHLLKDV